jgi:beta-lactamase superfamily II metal-dependent hydrolase
MLIGGSRLQRQVDVFNIKMLPAGHGDCICVEYGDAERPHKVLIDGGPYYGFKPLSKLIDEMASSSITFELMVITHVDCDHIDGIVKLLGAQSSNLVVKDVWFNAYHHLSGQPKDILGPVEGEMLSALIKKNRLSWNKAFEGNSVSILNSADLNCIALAGGLKLTLLSPTKTQLTELEPFWATEVRNAGLDPDSPEAALELLQENKRLKPKDLLGEEAIDVESLAEEEFEQETSKTNASSIAFLAEYQGKSCLFAGDAHPDVLNASLRSLLAQRGGHKLKLDAVKLSHHGSKCNTSPQLLQLLDCKRFLISSNGNFFHHPDRETIARIINESGPGIELFFNYRSNENKVWSNDYLQKHYRYKAHYPQQGQEGLTVSV